MAPDESMEVVLARIDTKVNAMEGSIAKIEEKLDSQYITRAEFESKLRENEAKVEFVRKIFVALIILAAGTVMTAMLLNPFKELMK